MAVTPANIIQLLKTASGLILTQKNLAIYRQDTWEEGNSVLNQLGVDTNQILGGIFSNAEEVLAGAKFSESLLGIGAETLSALAAYVAECEPISANFSETSTIMQHPLEHSIYKNDKSGYSTIANYIADHSIDNPRTISIRIVFPRLFQHNIHNQLLDLKTKKTLLVIVAKTAVYKRMVVTNFSHDEEPSTIDRPVYTINFREIQIQYPPENETKNADDASQS